MHRVRGASGDVLARGPGFPPNLSPRAPPSPPVSTLPQHHLPMKVALMGVEGFLAGTLQTDDTVLLGIHSTKYAEGTWYRIWSPT